MQIFSSQVLLPTPEGLEVEGSWGLAGAGEVCPKASESPAPPEAPAQAEGTATDLSRLRALRAQLLLAVSSFQVCAKVDLP